MQLSTALARAAVYTVASTTVLFVFLVRPGITGHPRADFPDQLAGTAYRPYVQRALVPASIRLVKALVPDRVEAYLSRQLTGRRVPRMLGWQEEHLADYAIACMVLLVYFVALAYVMRSLAGCFYDFPPALTNLAPLIGLLFLPLFFSYYSYLYDPGTLLTWSLSLLALVKGRFWWFAAAFILASINKETAILLVPLYGLHARMARRRLPVLELLGLVLIWGTIRAALGFVYARNPGGMVEHHWDHTVWLVSEFPIRLRLTLVIVALLAFLSIHNWREKPRLLRIGCVITLAPLFAAALFVGYADELRGYYEVYLFVYLLMLPSVYRLLGRDATPSGNPPPASGGSGARPSRA